MTVSRHHARFRSMVNILVKKGKEGESVRWRVAASGSVFKREMASSAARVLEAREQSTIDTPVEFTSYRHTATFTAREPLDSVQSKYNYYVIWSFKDHYSRLVFVLRQPKFWCKLVWSATSGRIKFMINAMQQSETWPCSDGFCLLALLWRAKVLYQITKQW